MKRSILLLFTVAASFISCEAQYTGPGSTIEVSTISYVLENAAKLDRKEKVIKVEGNIIEKITNETYWFQDVTGKIKVEIDSEDLPVTPFDETTKIRILGEVDHDLLTGSEIEAKIIEIVKTE